MNLVFDTLPEAEEDILLCGDYLAERNLSAAYRFAERFKCYVKILNLKSVSILIRRDRFVIVPFWISEIT
jgi:hypothetical protein